MKFVIFHGTYTPITHDWFMSLKNELEAYGHEVLLPQFPIDDYEEITAIGEAAMRAKTDRKQTLTNWLDHFGTHVVPWINNDPNTVFVGHSLGPVFILHAVLKYMITLKHAILVSPFLDDLDETTSWQFQVGNSTFYKTDFDKQQVKKLIPRSYVVYSTNDPYVTERDAMQFINLLDSTFIKVENGFHLGGKFNKLPLVEELCKSVADYTGMTKPEYLAK